MAQQKQNQSAKLHKHISSSDYQYKRYLGSQGDYAKYLVNRKDGISIDGSEPEY